ncbi:MAG: LysR family transcriptional regulator [Pseudomonadota bacterium]
MKTVVSIETIYRVPLWAMQQELVLELHQLRCFLAVVEEGGFKRATTRMHITQPALSYQMKQLEQELGATLFHRRPTGVTPTEAGHVLFEHARAVIEAVRRARRAVDELCEGVIGQVRVGTVNSVGIYFLPEILWSMQARYPTARLSVLYRDSNQLMEALLSNRLDLALIANPRPDPRLRHETIIEERVSLVCGRSHSFYGKQFLKPSDLNGVQFVSLSPENPTGDLVRSHLARLGVSVDPVVSTDNVETVKKMVEVGLGVAFLPDMVTSADVACEGRSPGDLWRIEIGPPLTRRITSVSWKNLEPSRAVSAFIHELREHGSIWKPCTET